MNKEVKKYDYVITTMHFFFVPDTFAFAKKHVTINFAK